MDYLCGKDKWLIDIDLFERKRFSTSVNFFKHTSVATTSYPIDADNVSTINDRRFVSVNVLSFQPSKFVDVKNVSVINDLLWLSTFVIYIWDFVDANNVSAMLRNCIIE
jgi:hypothetical protein